MRKVLLAVATMFCAVTMTMSTSDRAAAASAPNFSKMPNLESLVGPVAEPVAYYMYRKYHRGCYRPRWCKYKHYGKYKKCWWGKCYHHKRYHHMYKKHHFYKYRRHYYHH